MFARIREFTAACNDGRVPDKPALMTPAQVRFATAMVVEELLELLLVSMPHQQAVELVQATAEASKYRVFDTLKPMEERIGEQADALMDLAYFVGDVAARSGIQLDPVFELVHAANMLKVVDGKVRRSDEGKILKPAGWVAPDIGAEMKRQMS